MVDTDETYNIDNAPHFEDDDALLKKKKKKVVQVGSANISQ